MKGGCVCLKDVLPAGGPPFCCGCNQRSRDRATTRSRDSSLLSRTVIITSRLAALLARSSLPRSPPSQGKNPSRTPSTPPAPRRCLLASASLSSRVSCALSHASCVPDLGSTCSVWGKRFKPPVPRSCPTSDWNTSLSPVRPSGLHSCVLL